MQFLGIILFIVTSSCIYGIIHDQITARICIEYFTIAHPQIIESETPTALGFAWGIAATWWMGAMFGLLIAFLSRRGTRPKLSIPDLVKPVALVFASMAIAALIAAFIGRALATQKLFCVTGPLAQAIPPEKQVDFLTAACSHTASYAVALIGGIVLCFRILRTRKQLQAGQIAPSA